jgi:ketosteroid isomerase-like protein
MTQICGLLLLAALLCAGCVSSARKASLDATPAIQHRIDEICDAVQKKDLPRLDSYHLYGPRFSKFGSATPGREDAEAAREGEHKGISAANDMRMQAEDLKIDTFGDTAIATFILNYSFEGANGHVAKKARSTLVFVKDAGDWKIIHEHLSAIPGP